MNSGSSSPRPKEPSQSKMQHAAMQESPEGLGGWLVFFVVVFALNVITYFSYIFIAPVGVHTLINLLLTIGYLLAVVLIALHKKFAFWVIYTTLALSFIVSVINSVTDKDLSTQESVIAIIIASFIFHGLFGLYFYVSKRVKTTLVR